MKLTIDNLDGQGARDYTCALCPASPASGEQAAIKALTVERTLNAPSLAAGTLLLGAEPGSANLLPVPVRRGRVVISSSASGVVLFTGYLATEPVAVYAGVGLAGPVFRYEFSALSDEWLLDKQTATLTATGLNLPAGTLFTSLANRTDKGVLSTTGVSGGQTVGMFAPGETASWSGNAGAVAGTTYATYRAVNGTLSLNPVGAVTHSINFDQQAGSGVASPATLRTAQAKELANDVTLTGETEPAAYVTELFLGDGTTAEFNLRSAPFQTGSSTRFSDSFAGTAFNTQVWQVADPGARLAVGSGLTLGGGNGSDGETTVTAWDSYELGGSLVLEAADVQLGAPSDGVVLGLYTGLVERGSCAAGFNIRQSGGNTVATPYVSGMEAGTTYALLQGHRYTFRIRLHSLVVQRVLQSFYARVDGVIKAFGGGVLPAPVAVTFEVVDLGAASNTPAVVLYGGVLPDSAASCTFAPVNSLALTGSIGSVAVTKGGSAWIVSTLPGGATQTRLIGLAGQGVDCELSTAGKITFFAGRVPVAGEVIRVFYRSRGRSVARLADSASIAAEATGGLPGTARWLGKVLQPAARSSADCEAAAQAVLALASSRSAALAGSYRCINPDADVWPGDVLSITSAGQAINTVVRKSTVVDGNAAPEMLTYRIAFANDWAESLSITLSESVPADAVLPETAATAPNAVLADLSELAVVSTAGNVLQIDGGMAPPGGGGFEVRLRDFAFGAGGGDDLVLRSTVRSFSIPRSAQVEQYYIRMYDASTPPVYSRHSAAVFTNLPLTS